ncbi:MAG: hypothetical protein WA885_16630 [Phormidesmis sp.]
MSYSRVSKRSPQVPKRQPSLQASRPVPASHKNPRDVSKTTKALWAAGSAAALALLTIIMPTSVDSHSPEGSSCQEVVKSGAEISRSQISQLLTMPIGSSKAAVQQAIQTPYCTMPPLIAEAASQKTTADAAKASEGLEREAYPLAFDPEAWIVVTYEAGAYAGYDFVFKP